MSETREPKIHFPTWCVFCIRNYSFVILNNEKEFTDHMFKMHKEDMKQLVKDLETRIKLDKMLQDLADKQQEDRHKLEQTL